MKELLRRVLTVPCSHERTLEWLYRKAEAERNSSCASLLAGQAMFKCNKCGAEVQLGVSREDHDAGDR